MPGSKALYSRWVGNALVYYTSANVEIYRIDGAAGVIGAPTVARTLRQRVTTAQLNAGFTLLAATAGYKFRLADITLTAIGGAATTGTSVNVIGTQAAAPAQLVVALIAALTRSTVVKHFTANVSVLADGASFATNDVNTAITIITVGSAMTVMTALDVVLEYALET